MQSFLIVKLDKYVSAVAGHHRVPQRAGERFLHGAGIVLTAFHGRLISRLYAHRQDGGAGHARLIMT